MSATSLKIFSWGIGKDNPWIQSGFLLLMASAIRSWQLGSSSLWLDEATTVLMAWRDVPDIILSVEGSSPPLFFVLLHGWIGLFGSSEVAVRALSTLFGVVTVPVIYWAARVFFPAGRFVAFTAGLIVAISPIHLLYSQQCRMYTLSPLLGVLALVSLHIWLSSGKNRYLIAHAGLLALGLYTHNYFLFVLPVSFLIALLTPGDLGRRRALLGAGSAVVVAALLYGPWIPTLFAQTRSGAHAWIGLFWDATPPSVALLLSFEVMGVGGAFPWGRLASLRETVPLGLLWDLIRLLGFVLGVGLVLGGLLVGSLRSEREAAQRLGIMLLLPLLLPYLASFLIKPIYFVGRYEILVLPAYAILAGRGFDAFLSRKGKGVLAAALVATFWITAATLGLFGFYSTASFSKQFEVFKVVRRLVKPGDAVIIPHYNFAPGAYYLRRWKVGAELQAFPREVGLHPGWVDYEFWTKDLAATRADALELSGGLRDVLRKGGLVFLIMGLKKGPLRNLWSIEEVLLEVLRERLGPDRVLLTTGTDRRPTVLVFQG